MIFTIFAASVSKSDKRKNSRSIDVDCMQCGYLSEGNGITSAKADKIAVKAMFFVFEK
jgi:hypothetical protein